MVGAWFSDSDNGGGGHHRVERVAAVAQDAEAGLRGERVSTGDHGATADDGWTLGGPTRVGDQAWMLWFGGSASLDGGGMGST